jgi:long-chain acyl-CoA synthetase
VRSLQIIEELHFNRNLQVYKNRPANMMSMLEHSANLYPDREALVMERNRLTYHEMKEKVENIAGNLQQSYRIKKGDRVALLLGNSIEFALIIFACAKIGALFVPLNTKLKEHELSYMIEQSGSKILFVDDGTIKIAERMRDNRSINRIEHFFHIGTGMKKINRKDYLPYEILDQPCVCNEVNVNEDDPLFIMYTSGTTGLPKGAVGSHLGAIHSSISYEHILQSSYQTKTLIAVPLFHVTGLIGQLFHMVRTGGTSVIMRRYKTEDYIRLTAEENVTFLFNVPTIYIMMMSHIDFAQYSYPHVTTIAYGGAPMSAETIYKLKKYFPQAHFHNAYGATETSSPVSIMPKYMDDTKITSVGKPVPAAEIKIINDDGELCKPGEVGELLVKGPMVIPFYWDNEEANKISFSDGFWHSGDLATIDSEGFLYIMDRKKDMINRGGEKIYSIEVENVLYSHPDVLEAAVVGIEDELFGEVVRAVIVPKDGTYLTEEEIQRFAAQHLGNYKVPKEVIFTSELPRNPGGKVLKAKLKGFTIPYKPK